MGLRRDQVGKSGNGVLGITPLGFESQHRSALRCEAHQVQNALCIGYDALAMNTDFGVERLCEVYNLAGDSQVESEFVATPTWRRATWKL